MAPDERPVSEQFPRASQYHPEWVLANASGGANSLWLAEWLAPALGLRPGMRVLDLGCGRATEGYARRKEADARRRDKAQAAYVEDFFGAVRAFLAFHPTYADLAGRLARAVTDHATPVGSGTVARTKRIPVERRAEAAVIAWMRHQTTGYDGMVIPRIKAKRREVRRMLAQRSQELLERYRRGEQVPEGCPLRRALMTPQDELLDFLRNGEPTPAAQAMLKRTLQQFVL